MEHGEWSFCLPPEQVLSNEVAREITTWLRLMQQLVDESYDLLKDIHDVPIATLLEKDIP